MKTLTIKELDLKDKIEKDRDEPTEQLIMVPLGDEPNKTIHIGVQLLDNLKD